MHRRWKARITSILARFFVLGTLALSACGPPEAKAPEQPFDARDHFQGNALALAQAVDRRDAAAIRHLIKDEGVNPDTLFDQADMPMVAWPVINENLEGLRLLLDNGANPNARKVEPLRQYGKQRDNALVFAAASPTNASSSCCSTAVVTPTRTARTTSNSLMSRRCTTSGPMCSC